MWFFESRVHEEDEQETEQESWNKLDHRSPWMIMDSFPSGQRKHEEVTWWSGLYFRTFIIVTAYMGIWRGANRKPSRRHLRFILQTWGNRINNENQCLTSTYSVPDTAPGLYHPIPIKILEGRYFYYPHAFDEKEEARGQGTFSNLSMVTQPMSSKGYY